MNKGEIRRYITPEAIAAWRVMKEGEARRSSCLKDEVPCDSPIKGMHCAPCRAHIAAHQALDRALGLRPWEWLFDNEELVAALDAALDQQSKRRKR